MSHRKTPLGGEIAYSPKFAAEHCFSSGRDSLWTIFKSVEGLVNRLLLPDFLCGVILDNAAEFSFKVEFYPVDDQLISRLPACGKDDALYVINYFGEEKSRCLQALDPSVIAIVDDVFYPSLRKARFEGFFFTFNSLRKISHIPEISFLGSNFPINFPPPARQARFPHINRLGKQLKKLALDDQNAFSEIDERYYVDVLRRSEEWRNREKGPFRPAQESLCMLPDYYTQIKEETRDRRSRYLQCIEQLPQNTISLDTAYPSHAPLWLSRRDEAIKELRHNAIHLPGIWPRSFDAPNNKLYEHLLCVPLDARFTKKRLDRILDIIKDHL